MAEYRRPKSGEARELAELAASTCYGKVNTAFVQFVRELGGFKNLPAKFDIDSEAMKAAEREIDEIAATGNISGTIDLCNAYEKRFMNYLAAWRAKLSAMNQGVAA